MENFQCNDCGHTSPEDDFTGLSEEEVGEMLSEDMETGEIGSPEDYSGMVGVSACPECRSLNYTYLWD